MELAGYLAALLIGLSLGLIGGGGSILTVPVLVYLLGINPVMATAYSLFIVGSTSLVGAVQNFLKKTIDIKVAVVFATPSFLAVFLVRRFLMPALPQEIITISNLTLTKDMMIMIFFSLLMILTSFMMIRQRNVEEPEHNSYINYPLILAEGFIVGAVTGFVGAGGGFLIVPALVVLARLPMKIAVGTSLLIIAAKSLLGFLGDLYHASEMDWIFLLLFTVLAIAGVFAGHKLSHYIPGKKLKPAFGWFVLIMGVSIIAKELLNTDF